MVPCPRCGTQCPGDATACGTCGAKLTPAGSLHQTMVGTADPGAFVPKTPAREGTAPSGDLGKTMVGMPNQAAPKPPTPPPATAPAGSPTPDAPHAGTGSGSPKGSLNRTMLGFGAVPIPKAPSPSASPPDPTPADPAPAGHKQTMVGIAPPELAAVREQISQASAAGAQATPTEQAPGLGGTQILGGAPAPPGVVASGGGALPKKTMIGVARPGIAPIHAGLTAPEPELQPSDDYPTELTQQARPSRAPLVALGSVALAAVAVLVAALVYLLRDDEVVEAKVSLNAEGVEQLELACSECEDGTEVALEGHKAAFKKKQATLPVKAPLEIGDNRLTVMLKRLGDDEGEPLELNVPVEFRVRGDLAPLAETPPKVAVLVEARPGAKLVVNGKAIAVDKEGKARHQIDVSRELTTSAIRLKKSVSYTLTPQGQKPENGEVTFETPIAPLSVEAPGRRIVIEESNFMLAGQTQAGGTVSVAGRAITVDAGGRFAQLMNVSSEGETTILVRAEVPRHAPRLFPISIRRVKSLASEALDLRKTVKSSYVDLAKDPEQSRGTRVLFDALVVESRVVNHTTILLVEVKNGCDGATCLARVIYGSKLKAKANDKVLISGTAAGAVEGPRSGSRIIELHADFVMLARR